MKKQIAFRYKLDPSSADTWNSTDNQEIQVFQPNLTRGIALIIKKFKYFNQIQIIS